MLFVSDYFGLIVARIQSGKALTLDLSAFVYLWLFVLALYLESLVCSHREREDFDTSGKGYEITRKYSGQQWELKSTYYANKESTREKVATRMRQICSLFVRDGITRRSFFFEIR